MNKIKILALLRTLLIEVKQNQVFFPVQSVFITTDHLIHLFLFVFLSRCKLY